MMTASEAEWQYGISGALRFEETEAGLARAVVSTRSADAEMYLQGAHVTQWTPTGQKPVLFMSSQSQFAAGKAIRGGVPVIFPWFGAREARSLHEFPKPVCGGQGNPGRCAGDLSLVRRSL
jgi:glucose-6-phosphate 1-epimerase